MFRPRHLMLLPLVPLLAACGYAGPQADSAPMDSLRQIGEGNGRGIAAGDDSPRALAFALKMRLGNEEFLRLGSFRLGAGGALTGWYHLYRARDNSRPTHFNVRHPWLSDMVSYTRRALAEEGLSTARLCPRSGTEGRGMVAVPRARDRVEVSSGRWSFDGSLLAISVGEFDYRWQVGTDYNGNPYFHLTGIAQGGSALPAPLGYALLDTTPDPRAAVTQGHFAAQGYAVDYYQNNYNAPSDHWWFGNSRFHPRGMNHHVSSRLLSLWSPCPLSRDGRTHGMACQTSALLNAGTDPQMIYVEGGHDYTRNGCLGDEINHAQAFRMVRGSDGSVTGGVGIEYTFQSERNRSYPILSVFLLRPDNTSARPQLRILSAGAGSSGRVLARGRTVTLRWRADNAPAGAYVGGILLWKQAVLTRHIVTSPRKLPATGSFTWTVPGNLAADNNYGIQVVLMSAGGDPIATARTGYHLVVQ